MTELFRFIEQAFALPAPTDAIDAGSESDFQTSLRNAVSQHAPPERIRSIANEFLDQRFPTANAAPFALTNELLSFSTQLLALASPTETAIHQIVGNVFDSDVQSLVTSNAFTGDKELLNDALVSVKL